MTEDVSKKRTSQHAPLENLLTHLRTRAVKKYLAGKFVLDFGCGAHLITLRTAGLAARRRCGLDCIFSDTAPYLTDDGINIISQISQLNSIPDKVDVVTFLACFEHLEAHELHAILKELHTTTADDCVIVGTTPTPPSKPVLEFLSYKLGLIDKTQILEHKIYYNKDLLKTAIEKAGWNLVYYNLFQLGMNSIFVLNKKHR